MASVFFPKIMATFVVIFEFCWAFFRGQDPGIGDFHGRCCHRSMDPGEGWDGRSPFQWVMVDKVSLKFNSSPLKNDGWKMSEDDPFLLKPSNVSGASC